MIAFIVSGVFFCSFSLSFLVYSLHEGSRLIGGRQVGRRLLFLLTIHSIPRESARGRIVVPVQAVHCSKITSVHIPWTLNISISFCRFWFLNVHVSSIPSITVGSYEISKATSNVGYRARCDVM